jgi:hypothetical protein
MAVNAQPMVGNLAWAPLPAFEEVDVLDRFNGVPTLGTFGRPGSKILFWRVLGYVPPSGLSVWLYVPLSEEDERHLEEAEPSELLHGLVFQSAQWRQVTVGMAKDYRLFVEFDWNLPVQAPSEDLVREMLGFLASSLKGLADEESVTPARRRAARKASRAVRELAVC